MKLSGWAKVRIVELNFLLLVVILWMVERQNSIPDDPQTARTEVVADVCTNVEPSVVQAKLSKQPRKFNTLKATSQRRRKGTQPQSSQAPTGLPCLRASNQRPGSSLALRLRALQFSYKPRQPGAVGSQKK
ncbi:uncharacterized protein LOC127264293 isoform X3 [Andrographis paniculata]|uniref:uncharacterized protein LOC127264293 isoform X3 n=1 Tax=Andrographis paniculata TaxID=175694 RepID=UPI0021E833E0|nr:uncharacterized protein LOC127264293 isoform X3 [Andrographis paniculata]XP_051149705.1 uncharacterized protein LOC127264293 isoform X3 [Andrographis paniculata]